MMTQPEAWKLIQYYYDNGRREEDKSAFHKTCRFLMDEYGDTKAAITSGDDYYSDRDFVNARRNYQYAAERNEPYGYIGLGNLWHYGRCGTVDDQKAYECYQKAVALLTGREDFIVNPDPKPVLKDEDAYDDLINAVYQIADLYREGSYVQQSFSIFSSLIRYLYDWMKEPEIFDYYMPEVELRMADATLHENPDDQNRALTYLDDARKRMCVRLEGDSFFGDYEVMKDIVNRIHDLKKPDTNDYDLYDLNVLIEKPCTVSFICQNQKYEITREKDGKIHDRNHIYASVNEWLQNAKINQYPASFMNAECSDFSIRSEEKE